MNIFLSHVTKSMTCWGSNLDTRSTFLFCFSCCCEIVENIENLVLIRLFILRGVYTLHIRSD